MFDDLAAAGLPMGPLAQPRPVYIAPSGRGKYHLDEHCKQHLTRTLRPLTQIRDADLCSTCDTRLSDAEKDWAKLAQQLLWWRQTARDVVTESETVLVSERTEEDAWTWVFLAVREFRLRHREQLTFTDGRTALVDWATVHVAPVVAQARAVYATRLGWDQGYDWAARWAAASLLGGTGTEITIPGLDPGTYRALDSATAGQAEILGRIRDRIVTGINDGLDRSACRDAGARAGRTTIAAEPGTDPDPPDGTWRPAAAAEIEHAADLLTGAAFDIIDACANTDVELTAAVYLPIRGATDVADAIVCDSVVAILDRDGPWGTAALCFVPTPLVDQLDQALHHRQRGPSFGTVEPGDTVEVFVLAQDLTRKLGLAPDEALAAARATVRTVAS